MSASDPDRLRELVALCLDRLELEGEAAIEAVCREHPEEAAAIRERLALLARSGLLERPRDLDPPPLPERLGEFRLVRRLGEGGMGVVYLAVQEPLQREVALKVLRPGQTFFTGARERFRREVDAIARLSHPGVVPILAVGNAEGIPYFAMEKVTGATLADVIATLSGEDPSRLTGRDLARAIAARVAAGDGPVDAQSDAAAFAGSWTESCLRIVRQVADALDHVHRRGVLHRDLKPSNVMVTPAGRAQMFDFGLASTSGASRLTKSGTRLGSIPYLAPEQWSGRSASVDARTDVYALGVTLYELLALRVPYAASSAEALMHAAEVGRPDPVRAHNPAVPWEAETVCLTAMERDPARRYASAADFARDLENVLQHRPIEAQRPGPALRARRFVQRHPALTVGLVLGSLLVVGGPATFGWMEHESTLRLDKAYRRADGLRLSSRSTALLAIDPGLALLVAIEGAQRQPGATANDALYAALAACREEHALSGHGSPVADCTFAPDGSRVATASADGTAALWDVASGRELQVLSGHGGALASVEFSPDGARLLTAAADGQARLWDVATGACVHVLRGHRGAVNVARFRRDGRLVVTASADSTARIWDAESGRALATLADGGGAASDAAFSPDGRLVAVASADGRARLFDAESGACLRRLEFGGPVWCVRFDPSGARIALGGKANAARVYSVADGSAALPPLPHADLVARVEWSPDGGRLLTASWDHAVAIWDARTGERVATLRGPRRIVRFAEWSGDGALVLAGGDDAAGYVWNAATGRLVAILRGQAGSIGIGVFSRDGGRVATAGEDATVWRVPASARRGNWEGHRDKVQSIDVAPDGRRFVTASRDGTAKIWEVATLHLERTLQGHDGRVNAASFSADGRFVVTAGEDATARVWDAASGETIAQLRGHRERLDGACFDGGGGRVLTSSYDGTARIWDWRAQRAIVTLARSRSPVIDSAFSSDGARVVTVTKEGVATVWDAASGAALARLDRAAGVARLARFLPGGRLLVVVDESSVVTFDPDARRWTPLLTARSGKLQSVCASPDGRLVATSSDDTAIRIWDGATGEALATLLGHEELVPFITFTHDGAALVTASIDGDVRMRPADPLAAALAARPRELTAEEHVDLEIGDVAAWREACDFVRSAEERGVLAADVVDAVRRSGLGAEARAAALSIAAGLRDRPLRLARAAGATAHAAGRPVEEYRLALRRAEAALKLAPDGDGSGGCEALAAVALLEDRLGFRDDARAALAQLRQRAADPALAHDVVAPLLTDAEAALRRDALPAAAAASR